MIRRKKMQIYRKTGIGIAAAAMITIALILAWPRGGFSNKLYGMTDVPDLIRNANTLHFSSISWSYFNDPENPDIILATVNPRQCWYDLQNVIQHEKTSYSSRKNDGNYTVYNSEHFRDGSNAIDIDHAQKTVTFFKTARYLKNWKYGTPSIISLTN